MEFSVAFKGELIYWRGPSPFHFIVISPKTSQKIREHRKQLTYGWGAIPVSVTVKNFTWTTALIPKGEGYYLPIKDIARKNLNVELGDFISGKMNFIIK